MEICTEDEGSRDMFLLQVSYCINMQLMIGQIATILMR